MGLKITFINPNTEEQIVQAMAGVLAYNLAENDDKVIFDYKNSSSLIHSKSKIFLFNSVLKFIIQQSTVKFNGLLQIYIKWVIVF